jgi:hypothetical protein
VTLIDPRAYDGARFRLTQVGPLPNPDRPIGLGATGVGRKADPIRWLVNAYMPLPGSSEEFRREEIAWDVEGEQAVRRDLADLFLADYLQVEVWRDGAYRPVTVQEQTAAPARRKAGGRPGKSEAWDREQYEKGQRYRRDTGATVPQTATHLGMSLSAYRRLITRERRRR